MFFLFLFKNIHKNSIHKLKTSAMKPVQSKHDYNSDEDSRHSFEVNQNHAQKHQVSSESVTFNKNILISIVT